MTGRGASLALLRVLVLALWLAGLLVLGRGGWVIAVTFCVAAVLSYTFLPRPEPAEGALTYDRAGAVVIPDWLGILLGSVLFALPVWAAPEHAADGWLHPMAWLVWPIGLLFLSFTVIGWRHEAFMLTIGPDGLAIDTGRKEHDIRWDEIAQVSPWSRDLPKWMRRLAPLLAATGNPGQAGAIMIARESRGLALHLESGRRFVISSEAFERNARRLMEEFQRREVEIGRGLSHLKPRGAARPKQAKE
jgi:hypothetical protein